MAKQIKISRDPGSIERVPTEEEVFVARQLRAKENNEAIQKITQAEFQKGTDVVEESARIFAEESSIEIREDVFRQYYLKFFTRGGHSEEEIMLFRVNWNKGCRGDPTRHVKVVTLQGEEIGVMPPIERNLSSDYLLGEVGRIDIGKVLNQSKEESLINPIGAAAMVDKALEIKTAEFKNATVKDDFYIAGVARIYEYFKVTDDGLIPGVDFDAKTGAPISDLARARAGAEASKPQPEPPQPDDEWGGAYGGGATASPSPAKPPPPKPPPAETTEAKAKDEDLDEWDSYEW